MLTSIAKLKHKLVAASGLPWRRAKTVFSLSLGSRAIVLQDKDLCNQSPKRVK